MADVVVRFIGDASSLESALRDVDSSAAAAGSALSSAVTVAGTFAAGLLAAGSAAVGLAQNIADVRNALNDMSARTGVASDTLAGLKVAAEGSGMQLSELEGVLRKATASGLELDQVVATIQGIEDPTLRSAKAMELLGEEGGRLVQALGDSSLASFERFAATFGADTGPRAAEAAGDWQRAMAELSTVMEGFVDRVGTPLLEWGARWVRNFTRGMIFVGEVGAGVFAGLSRSVSAFVENLQITGDALVSLISGDVAGAYRALADIQDPGTVILASLDDVTAGFQRGLEKAQEYNAFLAGMGSASGAVAALNSLGGSMTEIVDETDNVIEVTGKAKASFGDWMQVAGLGVDLVGAMGDTIAAFGKKSETAMKAAFVASRAAAIGDVVVKTAVGIMNAFATLPTPAAAVAAPLIGATGALQLATVLATSFGSGGRVSAPSGNFGGGGGGGGSEPGAIAALSGQSGGITKFGADPDNLMRRGATSYGGAMYRHRDLDVVGRDSNYPGGAFYGGSSSGQSRYERG